ncbi:glycosyltransferase family 2 protein [Lachnotalea sp. AF33-28]|uniref:glycosyltransferase family 2 protein n=1 Tax=Lachnotalea sp. AF33-28 TaxID=2292046 RepID=UPI000E4B8079|nr:glycosyltransferase family 2 protein [Lachnotalea sp. AF33-28]RHP34977.1 glycosyltransferase [Lachnotalea sp. AF33-28]
MKDYKVSIITVCYHAETSIEVTLKSVLEQTYNNIEYIVKDGGSSDKTEVIVENYRMLFIQKGIDFKYYSEKDDGIYAAMNEAVLYANGAWVGFLNAGDTYYSNKTLDDVFKNKYYDGYSVIYGDTIEKEGDFLSLRYADMERIVKRMPFGHQSCFIRTDVMRAYPYDSSFRISADYHMILRLYNDKHKFIYCGNIISVFSMDGISSTNFTLLVHERERARLACGYGDGFFSYHYLLQYTEAWFKNVIQLLLPSGAVSYLRRYYIIHIKKNKSL